MSESIKVAVICTIKNEEKTIGKFMDSLLSQSRQPDEIVIVDGGSKDNTLKIIDSYLSINTNIKVILVEGANISRGRNIAIENASSEVIASTDAGCILSKDWLYWLIRSFENNPKTEVVSGWYKDNSNTEFGQLVEKLTSPNTDKIAKNPNKFLPSSRSIAYRKDCWQKVGGYPEWLYTAEDTLFDINLRRQGYEFLFCPNAVVYWNVGSNLADLFRKYFNYSKGDGEAKLFLNRYITLNYIPFLMGCVFLYYGLTNYIYILILLLSAMIYILLYSTSLNVNIRLNEYFKASLIFLTIILAGVLGYSKGLVRRIIIINNYL